MSDPINTFRQELERAGLAPGELVADGSLRRCGTAAKPRSQNGWYIFHCDPPASGAYGDWSRDLNETWRERNGSPLTPTERATLKARIEADRKARQTEEGQRHAEAADKARRILTEAPDCTTHPYLERKGVKPCPGLKLARDGRLIVPVLGEDGKAVSLQFIAADSDKRFLTGGRTRGGYFAVKGELGPLYLVEGLATGLTVAEATGATVLCAFNCGNLEPVARLARERYPERQIVVAADNDHVTEGNPGLSKATAAVLAVDALLAVPQFKEPDKGTDFNDLHQTEGLEAVRAQLAKAAKVEAMADPPEGPIVPVEFDQAETPAFDPAWFPAILAEFCSAVAEGLQVPFELAAINALSCVAVAGQRKYRVHLRPDYSEPVNIYALAALPPGERKSAAAEASKRPLVDWEAQAQEEARDCIRNTASERKTLEKIIEAKRSRAASTTTAEARKKEIEEIKALEAELPEVPAAPRLLVDDITAEGLPAFMERQEQRAGMIEAEGGFFDILAGRYSKGVPNLDAFLKSHSGEPVHVDRKGGPPIFLPDPALTICLSPQPEVIRDLADKPGFRGRGLIARFLYVLPKSRVGSREVEPRSIPQAVQARYAARLRSLLAAPWALDPDGRPTAYRLALAPDAYALWLDFARMVEAELRPGGELELMADWGGKLPGAAIRLAGLLHLVEHEVPQGQAIGAGTMRQALDLAAALAEHARAAFALMGADPDIECAKHILTWIRRERVERFQAREALRAVRGRYPKMEPVNRGLSILVERSFIFPERAEREQGIPGRPPSAWYKVNPQSFGGAS